LLIHELVRPKLQLQRIDLTGKFDLVINNEICGVLNLKQEKVELTGFFQGKRSNRVLVQMKFIKLLDIFYQFRKSNTTEAIIYIMGQKTTLFTLIRYCQRF
jgi:hypothetical protein